MDTSLQMPLGTNEYIECTFRVKTHVDKHAYWAWCCETLVIGYWKKMIGLMGDSATYCFHNAEDATAFKLTFGL